MATKRIEVGDLGFQVIDEGDGPPVMLLHGFPDNSQLWRNQIPALVEAGFRVVAPDLRGRGESDMPKRVEDYAFPLLLQDVAGIMDALGIEKANVVGHDWGSALAWVVASFAPERLERLVAISVGHPAAFSERTIEQLAKSWYMWIIQFPIAEELFSKDDWKLFRAWVGTQADANEYIEHLAKPGRLTAGFNWYRANITPESLVSPAHQFPPIACPVLAIHSDRDFALSERQMTDSKNFVTGQFQFERVPGAGHWIPLEEPERLNELLIGFLNNN
jgi:pimeloyl-ACP methyl ester carboxylesterase